MASGAKKPPIIRVAVCGLTYSSFQGMPGQGAGKSCLCNRFVRPKKDDLCLSHTSLMTHSDFGSSVINNRHFLYWGEKTVGLEDGPVSFQILEHTEFVEDGTLKPFPSTKPYHKRCIQKTITSGGQVQYIHPDQLAVPEEFSNVEKFPEKFVVDGFIVCIDVSSDLDSPGNQQKEFLEKLLPAILGVKKTHIVVAYTKFDIAKESCVATANEILAKMKRQLTVIEVSAVRGVNVDLCFLVLAHLIDSKLPRTKITSYAEADMHLKERVRKIEETFQQVLNERVVDFSIPIARARTLVENEVEYLLLQELCGKNRLDRLIRAKLNYLKEVAVKHKVAHFLDYLRASFELFLHTLSLSDTVESCKEKIRNSSKFSAYFFENKDWREDFDLLKEREVTRVPFSLLSEEGAPLLKEHVETLLAPLREDAACDLIRTTLQNTSNLIPGRDTEEVMTELGLADSFAIVPRKRAIQIYQERMTEVEQECVSDINELLLEHPNLFTLSEQDALTTVNSQLKDDVRYQRLEKHVVVRNSAIIKHIAVIKWPDKGPYAESHLLEGDLLATNTVSQHTLTPPQAHPSQSDRLQWCMDPDGQTLNIAILGRTNENALTLRSDFMNHLSGSGTCEVDGKKYQLNLSVFHDKTTSLTTGQFVPQGAVAVVNSMECLNWLEQLLESLWIPGSGHSVPYQGLPLVILALDESIMIDDISSGQPPDTPLCKRARQLANRLQCVLISERPTVQPKRLVVTTVISQLLNSLLDSVSSHEEFVTSDLKFRPEGFNIAVCTLAGDPYPPMDFLSPWLRHQAVCCDEKGKSLFLKCAIEKQHRIVNVMFYSSLNTIDLKKKVHLGYIVVFSPQRRASVAVLRDLLPKLFQLPMLIVAMTTPNMESHDHQVMKECQELANKYTASFITSSGEEWGVGYSSEFFSKCWFSRFTSWTTQHFSVKKRKPMALPDRPLPQPVAGIHTSLHDITTVEAASSSVPRTSHSLHKPKSLMNLRHSIAGELDIPSERGPLSPPFTSGTLPRSPRREDYKGSVHSPSEEQVYSNPIEITRGMEQKSSLKRSKERREHTLPRTPVSPPFSWQPTEGNDTYADPQDIIKAASDLARSPSTSPPPPPMSPPVSGNQLTNGVLSQKPEELYDTVQSLPPSEPKAAPPLASGQRYDHLMRRQVSHKYDHLQGSEVTNEGSGVARDAHSKPVGDWPGERPPLPLPTQDDSTSVTTPPTAAIPMTTPARDQDNLYATVDISKRGRRAQALPPTSPARRPPPHPQPGDMYSTVDTSRKPKNTTPLPVAGDNLYSVVDTARKPKKPPVPAPLSVPPSGDLYAVVDTSKKKRRTPPPPVLPKSLRSPTELSFKERGGGSAEGWSPERQRKPAPVSRWEGEHRRKSTEGILGVRRKSNENVLGGGVSAGGVPRGTDGSYRRQYAPDNSPENALYTLPSRVGGAKGRQTPPPIAPKPGTLSKRIPVSSGPSRSLPRGKSLDLADGQARETSHPAHRTYSPQLKRKQFQKQPTAEPFQNARARAFSAPNYGRVVRRGGDSVRGEVVRGDFGRSDVGRGDMSSEATDAGSSVPALPERQYSASEMGLDEEAPPLPPRNYTWSDVEDDDDDLFQSDDDLDESSSRISLDDQHAMYSSLKQYQRRSNTFSGIEEIYAMVNKVASGQEATSQPPQPQQQVFVANENSSVYDTLENALRQKEDLQQLRQQEEATPQRPLPVTSSQGKPQHRTLPSHSAVGPMGSGATVFTPKQLKLIKQQQKLLDKLQKKTEREAERRRKSEVRRRKREEDEQRKKEGRKKGKKPKGSKEPEPQRYFGSPLEKVVEEDGVPRFIKQCADIIEAGGLKIEGIYRVSGKKDDCLALQDQYDQDSKMDVAALGLCETSISSTLKAFFKLLPDPLIPDSTAANMLEVNVDNLEGQKHQLYALLRKMPRPNLKTLHYLMHHLNLVHQHQEVNKMTSTNLAIVFWPTLMRPPLTDLADPNKQLCWQLTMALLIEHPDTIPEVI